MSSNVAYTVREVDGSSGVVTKSYVMSKPSTRDSRQPGLRLDQIPLQTEDQNTLKDGGTSQSAFVHTYLNYLLTYLKTLFLPTGYPYTVSPDYTPYQIYDSIQAFASSIAGLLSSRAVLQSLNVISTASEQGTDSYPVNSTSAATAATLLSILRTTLANLTSILFASYAAPRISSEVKFYRFLADVVNDSAFVLDLLAPILSSSFNIPLLFMLVPVSPRVLVLCASSMLRAVCGVAGGSSKAVLSTHFARHNPESVGDLNAKDGSQETVVNLLGMWIGGFVVTRVEGRAATWFWMLGLLCLHLWANWQAVRSVRLRGLNRERAALVCEGCLVVDEDKRMGISGTSTVSITSVGSRESVLGVYSHLRLRWLGFRSIQAPEESWRKWEVGVSVSKFVESVNTQPRIASMWPRTAAIDEVLQVFEKEAYMLVWIWELERAVIALKPQCRPIDQLKSWFHAAIIQRRQAEVQLQKSRQTWEYTSASFLSKTLTELNAHWGVRCQALQTEGWNLDLTNLEVSTSFRISVLDAATCIE